MKIYGLLAILLFLSERTLASTDSLSTVLYSLIQEKEVFIGKKERDIAEIKKMREISDLSKAQQFEINRKLFDEYKTYISDSAIYYARENLKIAYELGDGQALSETKLILAT